MKVRTLVHTVSLDVSGEDTVKWGAEGHGSWTAFEPMTLEIRYEWFPERGFWRAQQSTARGLGVSPQHRGQMVEKVFVAQDQGKPLWVAALEFKFFPEPVRSREWEKQ